MKTNNYFYCYNKLLSFYIQSKGEEPITVAKHMKTNDVFSVFERNTLVINAIDEFNDNEI
ncbi:hypothetical protein [Salsuginibacillus kocurii]|uniref:hypothetical protein n=1 Tax=Salsuginibacillus kocurii TaxID=427078 RepID=UPI00037AAA47|nr:hypothetical protein [Salsuginibacillus kocurii]